MSSVDLVFLLIGPQRDSSNSALDSVELSLG